MTAVHEGVAPSVPELSTVCDFLGLTVEQRYAVIREKFPPWLLEEPIAFPRHHPTFGWACRVDDCAGALRPTDTRLLCSLHSKEYSKVQTSVSIDDFVRGADPVGSPAGWALSRMASCVICGENREARSSGYCPPHDTRLRAAMRRGTSEADWLRAQNPLSPVDTCSIPRCVRDGDLDALLGVGETRLCRSHFHNWRLWLKSVGAERDIGSWEAWLARSRDGESVTPLGARGQLTLVRLPVRVQCEIRYAIHRHTSAARRTQWRPTDLQAVVNAIADAGLQSLSDPRVGELAGEIGARKGERRIWVDLPFTARSLSVTSDLAKSEGWFDPVIVGGTPFPGTLGHEQRRKKTWNLTAVSQRWLRDLLWDYLEFEALKPQGKRLGAASIYRRINGITLLSQILRQVRADHGEDPGLLSSLDAKAVKDTWDLWYREQVPLFIGLSKPERLHTLTETTRGAYMSGIRIVMQHGRKQRLTHAGMDSFILGLPDYARPEKKFRPRPLSFGDFQLLVSHNALNALDAADKWDIGFADIWLTHAFQGGRIGETINLRLGCIGLLGAAQPYIWRDVSKVNIIDYGMPCHLPVYQRLLRRQSITRAKLRARYADDIASLGPRGAAQLEAEWDRTMPLFPSMVQNPDLLIAVSQCWFRTVFIEWIESLGLSGITTHQTRATLATSLLNNGAPATLVRQLLGHLSEESLAHYARYSDDNVIRHLQQVWAAGPGTDKPGTILLRPTDLTTPESAAAAARIDLGVVPVEHGLCRYGPVVGGSSCPFGKNCTTGPKGPCEHFVLTGADLAYWERKRDAACHFAEGAPNDEAREYILSAWHPWEPVLAGLREALDELGLLEDAEKLDLRTPTHDYFSPLFATAWTVTTLSAAGDRRNEDILQ